MVFWQKRTIFCILLYPFSIVYGVIVFLRRCLFKWNLKKTTQFPIPIIVVGNVTVGGTGKTPCVIWLAKFLTSQGLKVGIVSRGYGGNAKRWPQIINRHSQPTLVGDEAVLIYRQTQCPMVVAPDRVAAVEKLLAEYKECQVIISDDGLQHYALGRAIEIAVIDSIQLLGNGCLLPAGPLREPKNRLQSVDCIICSQHFNRSRAIEEVTSCLKSRYGLGQLPPLFNINRAPGMLYQVRNINQILKLNTIKQPVHAVTGIANPQRFFHTLRSMGLEVIEHSYPDHHVFRSYEIDFAKNDIIVMTEKDVVKCEAFADERHWCLPLQVTMQPFDVRGLTVLLSQCGVLPGSKH